MIRTLHCLRPLLSRDRQSTRFSSAGRADRPGRRCPHPGGGPRGLRVGGISLRGVAGGGGGRGLDGHGRSHGLGRGQLVPAAGGEFRRVAPGHTVPSAAPLGASSSGMDRRHWPPPAGLRSRSGLGPWTGLPPPPLLHQPWVRLAALVIVFVMGLLPAPLLLLRRGGRLLELCHLAVGHGRQGLALPLLLLGRGRLGLLLLLGGGGGLRLAVEILCRLLALLGLLLLLLSEGGGGLRVTGAAVTGVTPLD